MVGDPICFAHPPDITYESLGKAFDLPVAHHEETLERMQALTTPQRLKELENATPEERTARARMALVPTAKGGHGSNGEGGARSEMLFVSDDRWVPVLRLEGKVSGKGGTLYVSVLTPALRLPRRPQPVPAAAPWPHAVPPSPSQLFQAVPPADLHCVSSPPDRADTRLPESRIATYLGELAARVKAEGIRIGSCR
jgi:hypothetical protein